MKYFFVALIILTSFNATAERRYSGDGPYRMDESKAGNEIFKSYEEISSFYNKNAYNITLQMCLPPEEADWYLEFFIHHAKSTYFLMNGFVYSTYLFSEKSYRIAPEIDGLLSSDGYYTALTQCFGDDRTSKDDFTKRMIGMDFIGRSALSLLSFSAIQRGFTWASQKAWSIANPKTFTLLASLPDVYVTYVMSIMGYYAYSNWSDKDKLQTFLGDNPCAISPIENDESTEQRKSLLNRTHVLADAIYKLKRRPSLNEHEQDQLLRFKKGLKELNPLIKKQAELINKRDSCTAQGKKIVYRSIKLKDFNSLQIAFANLESEAMQLINLVQVTKPKDLQNYRMYAKSIGLNIASILQDLELNPNIHRGLKIDFQSRFIILESNLRQAGL